MILDNKIDVLDHGLVRVVDFMGSDLAIVRSARTSHNAAWRAGLDEKSDAQLINYLYLNHHNTPFESVELQFEVKAPISVLRQWHRHRTQSYNEVSARYTKLPEIYYVPEIDVIGKQHKSNKQARDILATLTDLETSAREKELVWYQKHCTASFELYGKLLDKGWPRELARNVLPFATYSHMFAKMNLHNLFRFLSERLHPHAQYEIRVYAQAILELIEPIVPVAVKAFKEHTLKIEA